MNARSPVVMTWIVAWTSFASVTRAGDLILELGRGVDLSLVGAVRRWDSDGADRAAIDPKARIEKPRVDATGRVDPGVPGRYRFTGLEPGRYDLVLISRDRERVEGFHYPPVLEFDSFLSGDGVAPESAAEPIRADIARGRHFENRVEALFLAGDERQVRVLTQLVRDQPTSFDAEYGQPAATIRHEVWRYDLRYGRWTKERTTRVLDRVLMPRSELGRWTWVWEPRLGGIEVGQEPIVIHWDWPERFEPASSRGWLPK